MRRQGGFQRAVINITAVKVDPAGLHAAAQRTFHIGIQVITDMPGYFLLPGELSVAAPPPCGTYRRTALRARQDRL